MFAPDVLTMTILHPGDQLDYYRIDELVARGGMASIFRGTDLRNERRVAIKVPHDEVKGDPALFDRFRREEEIGRTMDHPGVMKVFTDQDRSQVYMVMEWVEGRRLRNILDDQHKLPQERTARITQGILDALEYIHSHGVIHRDLKPENIMVNDQDNIKLIDFGIAGSAKSRRLTFSKFSQMGTPDYISPEQVKGKRGDARSDLYALGVMLYEMLTGKVPFSGENPLLIMNDRLLNSPVPPREIDPTIAPQLQEVIYRALERDPNKRYQSTRDFSWDLQHQDKVGASERPELHDWKERRAPWRKKILLYGMLVLIPVAIFALLLYVARHS
jgi:serine/threonine-protein kinase